MPRTHLMKLDLIFFILKSTLKSFDLSIFFSLVFFETIFQFHFAVNNVGRMYDYPDELGKLSPDFLWSMVNININSVTMMTRMLVNDMKKRGKGAIVNLSSGSELQPLPYAAVYGASKVSVIFDTINTYIARVIHSIIPAFGLDLREEFYISNAA